MTINELQDNVIEEFSVFDDWIWETPFPRLMRNIKRKAT